jgi:hypothetical protein
MRFSELVSSIRGSGVGNPFCVSVRCPIGSSGHYGVGPPPDLDFSWILEREERGRERERERERDVQIRVNININTPYF